MAHDEYIVWWYSIGFYVISVTFKVAPGLAALTFGRDAIFSFCQPAHELEKVAGKNWVGRPSL